MQRSSYWDNVKGILIILVVFAHLLEIVNTNSILYKFIYLFHMPLFVFVSGYFAKFNLKKIILNLLIPYLIIQMICCVIMKSEIQFITPFWILWYLFDLILWKCSCYFLEWLTKKQLVFFMILMFLVSLMIGFDNQIGYVFSLSRLFVFYPYFLLGFFVRRYSSMIEMNFQSKYAACIVLLLFVVGFYSIHSMIDAKWLYGSYSYESAHYSFVLRLLNYLISYSLSLLLLILIPKKKSILSKIGEHSYFIYLAHILLIPCVRLLRINNIILYLGVSILFCEIVLMIKRLLCECFMKKLRII